MTGTQWLVLRPRTSRMRLCSPGIAAQSRSSEMERSANRRFIPRLRRHGRARAGDMVGEAAYGLASPFWAL